MQLPQPSNTKENDAFNILRFLGKYMKPAYEFILKVILRTDIHHVSYYLE